MGWSGRAPARQRANWQQGTEDKGACHVPDTQQQDRRNRHRYRQERVPRRWPESTRGHRAAAEMVAWPGRGATGQAAAVLIGMEACVGAHHLSRKLQLFGHNARLMPAKYVRPYSKGQKNDFRDAEAIAEAVQRPTMKFV